MKRPLVAVIDWAEQPLRTPEEAATPNLIVACHIGDGTDPFGPGNRKPMAGR